MKLLRSLKEKVMVEIKPCPCCGNTKHFWVGVQSSMTYGVECLKCRLTLEKSVPSRWPPGVATYEDGNLNSKRLHHWTLLKAIAAWNKRPRKPNEQMLRGEARITH